MPDPVYKDPLVTRFVNCLMMHSKKNLAYKVFYSAVDRVQEQTGNPGLEVWKQALDNVMPSVEIKSRRLGGTTLQVPIEARPERRVSLSIKWLVRFARQRKDHTIAERLAKEIVSASRNEGNAVRRKEEVHRMAEANKAFSHFRF